MGLQQAVRRRRASPSAAAELCMVNAAVQTNIGVQFHRQSALLGAGCRERQPGVAGRPSGRRLDGSPSPQIPIPKIKQLSVPTRTLPGARTCSERPYGSERAERGQLSTARLYQKVYNRTPASYDARAGGGSAAGSVPFGRRSPVQFGRPSPIPVTLGLPPYAK